MATGNKPTPEKSTKSKAHLIRRKGEPRPMPRDFKISLGAKGGTDQQL